MNDILKKFNINIELYKDLKSKYENFSSEENLNNLKVFLDLNNIKFPVPLWKYKEEDITTWKYLDGKVNRNSKGEFTYKNVINPEFKFG